MEHRPSCWSHLAGVLLFVVGLQMGVSFPDLDQRTPLLIHRSLLTYAILAAGAALTWPSRVRSLLRELQRKNG